LRYDRPFNFSAINNFAAAEARGGIVGLLNNDLEFVEPGWLAEMVSHAVRPEVGAVGARLLYPDRTVQHAGVVLGIGGLADHVHKNLPEGAPGYCGRAGLTQDFSAVTAACLLVRRKTYFDVGGFDEAYAVAFNDVDFCLRLRQRGLQNVWTPFATVIHHESKTRGREDTLAKLWRFRGEKLRLAARWSELIAADPAYNPNLTVQARNFSLAWPPRVTRPWR
jgi:O-antigen biosynthesis protein